MGCDRWKMSRLIFLRGKSGMSFSPALCALAGANTLAEKMLRRCSSDVEDYVDLGPTLSLVLELDGASDLGKGWATTRSSRDGFEEKRGRAFAEFAVVALITLGEVPHQLSGEAADGLGQGCHSLVGLPVRITALGGLPPSNRSN